MRPYLIRIADPAPNPATLPKYQIDKLDQKLDEARRRHLVYVKEWLFTAEGLWHPEGYTDRPGWRKYRPRRSPPTNQIRVDK